MIKVARELGINDKTLSTWVQNYRREHAADPLPDNMPDNERVKAMEKRIRDLEAENAFLKKAAAYFAKEQR